MTKRSLVFRSLAVALALAAPRAAAQIVELTPFQTFAAGTVGDHAGFAVAVGDVNGDGKADIVLGIPGSSDQRGDPQPLNDRGRIVVFSGVDGSEIFSAYGGAALDQLGTGVAVLPDLDGDGLAEFAAGAVGGSFQTAPIPYVKIYSLKNGGGEFATYMAAGPLEHFGATILSPGDVNGDGTPDILVGGPGGSNGNPGVVRMMSGASSFPNQVVLWERSGVSDENLGASMCALDDLDDDGVKDVAIAAPGYDVTPFSNHGIVYILSGKTGDVLRTFVGKKPNEYFGSAIANIGHIDSDGIDDLGITVRYSKPAPFALGSVLLVNPKSGKTIRTIANKLPTTSVGISITGIGDMTGDGIPDVAVGASSNLVGSPKSFVWFYSGATGALIASATAPVSDLLGLTPVCLAFGGDFDHDGLPDLVAGAFGASPGGHLGAGEARAFSLASLTGLGSKGKLKIKMALQRPASPPDADANGAITLEVNGVAQVFSIDINKIEDPSVTQLFGFVEDGIGSGQFVQVVELTKSSKSGKWKAKLTDPSGLPPAVNAKTFPQLAGRAAEVRDAMGAVYLTAVIPSLTDTDDVSLTLPMTNLGVVPAATGSLKLTYKGSTGSSQVVVSTKSLDKAVSYAVFVEDPAMGATFTEVGPLVNAKYSVDTKTGAPLPLGVPTLLDLAGRKLQIRDGATVVLEVQIPG
jgi:hypothetical protein